MGCTKCASQGAMTYHQGPAKVQLLKGDWTTQKYQVETTMGHSALPWPLRGPVVTRRCGGGDLVLSLPAGPKSQIHGRI